MSLMYVNSRRTICCVFDVDFRSVVHNLPYNLLHQRQQQIEANGVWA